MALEARFSLSNRIGGEFFIGRQALRLMDPAETSLAGDVSTYRISPCKLSGTLLLSRLLASRQIESRDERLSHLVHECADNPWSERSARSPAQQTHPANVLSRPCPPRRHFSRRKISLASLRKTVTSCSFQEGNLHLGSA